MLAVAARSDGLGRLAVSRPGAPIVQPVNFVYHGGELLVRLGDGFMVEVVPGRLVAFEVDGVDEGTGVAWSVLVRGLARLVRPGELDLRPGSGPQPMAPIPGEQLVALRPEVVTGRRFPLNRRGGEPAAGSTVGTGRQGGVPA